MSEISHEFVRNVRERARRRRRTIIKQQNHLRREFVRLPRSSLAWPNGCLPKCMAYYWTSGCDRCSVSVQKAAAAAEWLATGDIPRLGKYLRMGDWGCHNKVATVHAENR